MRNISLLFALCLLVLFSCRKDKNAEVIHAVVKMKVDGTANTYVVEIVNPDASKQAFLCDKMYAMASSSYYNCGNAAFITNLPASLAVQGRKIRFSAWIGLSGTQPPTQRQAREIQVLNATIDL